MTTLPPQHDRAIDGDDPRGILTFVEPLPESLQGNEDATQKADFTRRLTRPRGFERLATTTERELLQTLGYQLPDELTTAVSFPASGVRRRVWPQIEGQEITP